MRNLGIAGVLVAALLGAACGGHSKPALPTVVTTTSVAITAPPPPQLKFSKPEEAVRHLILQWQAGDRQAAGQAATPEAVAALFGKPAKQVQFRSCDSGASASLGSDCAYRYDVGLIKLHLTNTNGDWKVATVTYEGV
ncbi:MAG: hypothetical protein H0W70_10115 [Actinobacteria bacterium]|nr:hypothetical protein [Actinomycetota bacterium]